MSDAKDIIPAGQHVITWLHMIPVVELLIERGHIPLYDREEHGFGATSSGTLCQLSRHLTDEDWEAINKRFEVPKNIAFLDGIIRDSVNRVDIIGYDHIHMGGVRRPIEEWEEREREAGRL